MKSKHITRSRARKQGGRQGATRERIVRMTLDEALARAAHGETQTDWARVDAMTEAEVEANALADPDNPPLTDEMLRTVRLIMPSEGTKTPISFRVDSEVLTFFKQSGRGYQSRMNAVLRAYMHTQTHHR